MAARPGGGRPAPTAAAGWPGRCPGGGRARPGSGPSRRRAPGRLTGGGSGGFGGVPGPLAELAHLMQVLVTGRPVGRECQRRGQLHPGVGLLQQRQQGRAGRRRRAGPERRGVEQEGQRPEQGLVPPVVEGRQQPHPAQRVAFAQRLPHQQDGGLGVDAGEGGEQHLAVAHGRKGLAQRAQADPHGLGAPAFQQRLEGADHAGAAAGRAPPASGARRPERRRGPPGPA